MVAGDPQGAFVYEDESWFVGKAYGGRCWEQRGRPTWIPAFGPKQGEVLYLCLEPSSGELVWRHTVRTNGDATIECLAYLAEQYAGRKYLVVVWDNASWHKAAHVARWLEVHNAVAGPKRRPKLFVFYLPTYSPWLNPVEAIFNQTKRRVLFGRNLEDPARRRQTLDNHFTQRNARLLPQGSVSFKNKH